MLPARWSLVLYVRTSVVSVAAVLILSAAQKYWAVRAYQVGETNGLGLTLSAVVYQESSYCQNKVNGWSRGCGGLKRSTARLYDPEVTRAELTEDNSRNLRDSLLYLLDCRKQTDTWRRMVYAYHYGIPAARLASVVEINSDGYVKAIERKVKILESIKVSED